MRKLTAPWHLDRQHDSEAASPPSAIEHPARDRGRPRRARRREAARVKKCAPAPIPTPGAARRVQSWPGKEHPTPEQPSTPDAPDSRIAGLREAVARREYEAPADLVAAAVVRRLTGRELPSELPTPTEQASTPHAPDSRIAGLRKAVGRREYEVPADLVAAAIVRRLTGRELPSELPTPTLVADAVVKRITGRELASELPDGRRLESQITIAPARPSTEELARAQLNRYAIDLRHSYERELKRSKTSRRRSWRRFAHLPRSPSATTKPATTSSACTTWAASGTRHRPRGRRRPGARIRLHPSRRRQGRRARRRAARRPDTRRA